MDPRVCTATPVEHVRELVESALQHQGLETDELTAHYLVNLLCGVVPLDRSPGEDLGRDAEPLALRRGRALQSEGVQQKVGLRHVGDLSLFISGFFSDSLCRECRPPSTL